jgi:ParB-like chromosome segregation protein Spo0J
MKARNMMSPTQANHQPGNGSFDRPGFELTKPSAIPVAEAAARVKDLPTDTISTPADSEIDLETVEELRGSMAEHGQYQEIIVFPDVDNPGRYVCADGNHRLAAKRLLRETIRARILDKAPNEAELITVRVSTATIRKTVDSAAVAADILRWMELTGADQIQAMVHFGYKSESAISKLLRPYKNGIEELLAAIKERRIATTSAYLVASLPPEVQRALLPQVLGKKREAVRRIVQDAKGRKPKAAKTLKLACGGVVATIKGDYAAALREFIAKATEALKKLERDKLPPEFLGHLMQ